MKKLLSIILASLLFGCSVSERLPVGEPSGGKYEARGRELVEGLAACGFCHGAKPSPGSPLIGGQLFRDKYGDVTAPNLTPAQSDTAAYGAIELMQVFRAYQNMSGRQISKELHKGFEWMSDPDSLSIVSYIKSLPAQGEAGERRSISFISRNTTGFMDSNREVAGYVPDFEPRFETEYGRYLVDHVARCTSCHNTPATLFSSEQYLGGGAFSRPEKGEKLAPNLAGSTVYGLGEWSESDIIEYLESGRTRSGSRIDADYCPVEFYATASGRDRRAIAKYLKSLPGQE